MLDELRLDFWKNCELKETGIDSYQFCQDKFHFLKFPFDVSYNYNSRGFRDEEWPTSNLNQCIWCVGDSFTVGLGSPVDHTWVKVLQKQTNNRTINISMDGASNHWIARNAMKIIKQVQPQNMVVMFSYFHRRELPLNVPEHQKRLRYIKYETIEDDIFNFQWCFNAIEKNKHNTNIIYLTIPKPLPVEHKDKIIVSHDNWLGEVEILDYARDKHHFDIKTSESIVTKIMPLLAN